MTSLGGAEWVQMVCLYCQDQVQELGNEPVSSRLFFLLIHVTGVFAGNKKTPKGLYIDIYAGKLLTERQGEAHGRCVRDAKRWTCICVDSCGRLYDMYCRTYLFSVHFHHLKLEMGDQDGWEDMCVVDTCHAGSASAC